MSLADKYGLPEGLLTAAAGRCAKGRFSDSRMLHPTALVDEFFEPYDESQVIQQDDIEALVGESIKRTLAAVSEEMKTAAGDMHRIACENASQEAVRVALRSRDRFIDCAVMFDRISEKTLDDASYVRSSVEVVDDDAKKSDHSVDIKMIVEKFAQRPLRATEGSAGYDLFAFLPEGETIEIPVGEVRLIQTGVKIELPKGMEAQIRPRSGLAFNHGITVLNAPGTIDSDYRGHIGVLLINLGDEPFTVKNGYKIAQMVFGVVPSVCLLSAEVLEDTDRGSGGFGSTGK